MKTFDTLTECLRPGSVAPGTDPCFGCPGQGRCPGFPDGVPFEEVAYCDYCHGPGGVPRGDAVTRVGDTLLDFPRPVRVCPDCWAQLNSDQRAELAE